MRGDVIAKLGLAGAAIFGVGGAIGLGLANFAESGDFEFYRHAPTVAWEPGPERAVDAFVSVEAPAGDAAASAFFASETRPARRQYAGFER
ncbi:hypothetical protein ACG3SL_09385 [Sphingomonas sp. CJ20]